MKYSIIGIKGAGCSALANILNDLKEDISGYDYDKTFYTDEKLKGILVESFADFKLNVDTLYIIGNAYINHPICKRIIQEKYQYCYYPDFIERYFVIPKIGVCGSHGKSSTTFFISQMVDCNIDVLIGDGTGIGDEKAKYLILEACEYKRHFLKYHYEYLVVLNIDFDHPDYFINEIDYEKAFKEVSAKTKCLIINYDDDACRRLRHSNVITFGFNQQADMVIRLIGGKLSLSYRDCVYFFDPIFNAKGYLYDFAAAFLVSLLICENVAKLKENSLNITFPTRRMNVYFDDERNNIYIDDYAHHPTEIKNVIEELKFRYKNKRIIIVFQPHTFTRTITFYEEFKRVFSTCEDVYIASVFSSVRERRGDEFIDDTFGYKKYDDETRNEFLKLNNVVIAFLGAGDIGDEIAFFIRNKKDY